MTLQQVSLSGVIICPDQELEQRFAVNSFTRHLFHNYKAIEPIKDRSVSWRPTMKGWHHGFVR
jgi:hypothetical protein